MNSLVSYDWLSEYVDLNGLTPDDFAKRISLSGPAVEKMYPQGTDLDKIVVGHVRDVKAHPNADKLRIAEVEVGKDGKKPKLANIVCGGSNLVANQWVVVALPGARVRWHGEGEPIVLEPTEIRGVASEGMICASEEIGLAEAFPGGNHEILDLGVALGWSVSPDSVRLVPGSLLADALGLSSDVVMDIEVTSNRVDAMGMVGMAREAAAILKRSFLWKPSKLEAKVKSPAPTVKITAKKQCSRYMAVRMDGVRVAPSPWWLKRRLLSAGIRPINNIVDISNFVMLELAQPTHVFDAEKIEGGINVRLAKAGETMKALDGKMYELPESVLVIADKTKPVAIAGVMGGEETGVTEATTSVLIECANFDPVTIRRGARKLNLQSDAQSRFEKGLSTAAIPSAMARMMELIAEIASGTVATKVADVGKTTYTQKRFSITTTEVNALIGVSLKDKEMVDILRRLGFDVSLAGKKLTARVPWWRDCDIEDGRDFVEEIARVQGYANIPPVVPVGVAVRARDVELSVEQQVRVLSKGAGLTETYTYSFVSEALLQKAGYDATPMLRVQNPLSADFVIMRTTLLPSLLDVAAQNVERFPEQRLFEVSNVYYPTSEHWTNLPDEQLELGALFMGMLEPWRVAKGYVEHIFAELGVPHLSWKRLSSDAFWHPGRSVQAFYEGTLMATLGEVSPAVAGQFKLTQAVALVDIPLEAVLPLVKHARTYVPASVFPEAKRDVAVVVDARTEYDDIARAIRRVDALVTNVEWFDTYRGKNLPEQKKSLAMHVTFSAPDRTLESREVDAMMEKIVLRLKQDFGADLRV